MSANAQLIFQLRTLKLSGILDTLDLRILESQQNQLGYSEFLSFLLQDEIEKRNQRKMKRLLANSGMGQEKTLESFDFAANSSLNPALSLPAGSSNRGKISCFLVPQEPEKRTWPRRFAIRRAGTT